MIPKIDPDVKYIGSSKLRDLTAIELRALTGAIVVTGAQNTPLAVILPYDTYLKMQQAIEAAGKFEARFWEGEGIPISGVEEVAEEFRRGIRVKGDTKR